MGRGLAPTAALLLVAGCASLKAATAPDPQATAVRDLGDARPEVRARAAADLEHGGAASVAPLVAVLSGGPDVARYEAVRILGRLGPAAAAAAPRLVEMVRAEELAIPVSVADALAGIGAPAVPPLLEALRDPDEAVRYWTVRALGGMRPPPAAALEALTAALDDPAESVQGAAAQGLIGAGGAAVPALLRLLLGDDLDRATASADLLEQIGTPDAVAALGGDGDEAQEDPTADPAEPEASPAP